MQVIENFLDKDSRETTLKKVKELKEHWLLSGDADGLIPFYTLGVARYLIGKDSQYQELFEKYNPVINENFNYLHEKIRKQLEDVYQVEFINYDNSSIPGFHIFENDMVFEIPLASRHVDLQYKKIDWQDIEIDVTKTLSFTLYLKLPANGGGVYYWNKYHEDFEGLTNYEREEILHKEERFYKSFNEGDLFIHNGHQFHQIAPFFDIQDEDERISMQGHAIYSPSANKYFIHW